MLSIWLIYDPVIPLQENGKHGHTKTCTRIFITALFIKAKKWKQPKCPSVDE